MRATCGAGARKERLDVLQEGRRHELVAVRLEEVEDRPAQALHRARLGGQDIFDVLR
jgi:hypothetical protein